MERNIVLYIAVSLDGYIARKNGAVDWLTGHSGDTDVMQDLINSIVPLI